MSPLSSPLREEASSPEPRKGGARSLLARAEHLDLVERLQRVTDRRMDRKFVAKPAVSPAAEGSKPAPQGNAHASLLQRVIQNVTGVRPAKLSPLAPGLLSRRRALSPPKRPREETTSASLEALLDVWKATAAAPPAYVAPAATQLARVPADLMHQQGPAQPLAPQVTPAVVTSLGIAGRTGEGASAALRGSRQAAQAAVPPAGPVRPAWPQAASQPLPMGRPRPLYGAPSMASGAPASFTTRSVDAASASPPRPLERVRGDGPAAADERGRSMLRTGAHRRRGREEESRQRQVRTLRQVPDSANEQDSVSVQRMRRGLDAHRRRQLERA